MQSEEGIINGGDLNGYIGVNCEGFAEVMGPHMDMVI